MFGVCGIKCSDCPAFIAAKKNDNKLRERTAEKWNKEYGYASLKAKDINCAGCTTEGAKFAHCAECEIRRCGALKKVSACVYCPDYPCEKERKFQERAPDAAKGCEELLKRSTQ